MRDQFLQRALVISRSQLNKWLQIGACLGHSPRNMLPVLQQVTGYRAARQHAGQQDQTIGYSA